MFQGFKHFNFRKRELTFPWPWCWMRPGGLFPTKGQRRCEGALRSAKEVVLSRQLNKVPTGFLSNMCNHRIESSNTEGSVPSPALVWDVLSYKPHILYTHISFMNHPDYHLCICMQMRLIYTGPLESVLHTTVCYKKRGLFVKRLRDLANRILWIALDRPSGHCNLEIYVCHQERSNPQTNSQ